MEKSNRKNAALVPGNLIQKGNDEINLTELFYRLQEKFRYIILSALLCAALEFSITVFLIAPKYMSTAKLYVVNAKDSAINLSDLQLGNYLAADFIEVFENHIVHERVIENLGLDYEVSELSKMVEISNPKDTRLLYISVTSKSAQESMVIANEYASVAREFIAASMDMDMPNIFEDAELPIRPASPSKAKNTVIGFLVGLVFSCGAIVLSFLIDDKVRTSDDIQKHLALTTLGILPSVEAKSSQKE